MCLISCEFVSDTLAIVRERWLIKRGSDLSMYGEHVRDLMRPQVMSDLLSVMNVLYVHMPQFDAAWIKVTMDFRCR